MSHVFPDLRLVIARNGYERPRLERMVASSNLDDKVSFLGEVKRAKVLELLSECKLFVVPSRIEGFGAVLLEAMATGTPAVACSVGGIPEIMTDRETGVLVPGDNAPELARTLESLLRDDELLARLGSCGQKAVAKKYDWAVIAEEYLQIYRQAVRDPSRADVR